MIVEKSLQAEVTGLETKVQMLELYISNYYLNNLDWEEVAKCILFPNTKSTEPHNSDFLHLIPTMLGRGIQSGTFELVKKIRNCSSAQLTGDKFWALNAPRMFVSSGRFQPSQSHCTASLLAEDYMSIAKPTLCSQAICGQKAAGLTLGLCQSQAMGTELSREEEWLG